MKKAVKYLVSKGSLYGLILKILVAKSVKEDRQVSTQALGFFCEVH